MCGDSILITGLLKIGLCNGHYNVLRCHSNCNPYIYIYIFISLYPSSSLNIDLRKTVTNLLYKLGERN